MKKLLLTFGIAVVASLTSIAQIGTIDPNFNLGTGFGPDQWTGKCETVIQQSDGKLLVGGQFKTFNGNPEYYIARLNLNGTVDNSFTSPFDDSWGAVVNIFQLTQHNNDGSQKLIGQELSSGYDLYIQQLVNENKFLKEQNQQFLDRLVAVK